MSKSQRLISLDVLRGMTIALMITVNTPGSWDYVYPPLRHAKWHGCTPTDLVFPFFLFIVGVSMWYSFKKYEHTLSQNSVLKILKRTILIFTVGLFLNLFPFFDFEKARIMGVLQRIALAYGLAAILCLALKNIRLYISLFCILIVYWIIMWTGGESANPYAPSTNLARYVDLWILGEAHMWKGLGFPFDPEGILSTLPAIGTVVLGYITGRLIETSPCKVMAVKKLLVWGAVIAICGWLWGYLFPINKSLWTSSYVLYTGGLAMLFLACLLWIIDVQHYRKWAMPFVHFGMNPLFIYVLSGLYVRVILFLIKPEWHGEQTTAYKYLYKAIFVPLAGPMNGSLLFAITHIVLFWLIVYVLYKKRIFIKI